MMTEVMFLQPAKASSARTVTGRPLIFSGIINLPLRESFWEEAAQISIPFPSLVGFTAKPWGTETVYFVSTQSESRTSLKFP